MKEVVCEIPHRHNGLCYVAEKQVPPEIQWRIAEEYVERGEEIIGLAVSIEASSFAKRLFNK